MAVAGEKSVKEKLIIGGIEEIAQNGLQNLSVRRVANNCGVSCAAPYKHFKNRVSFIAAVIEYINDRWFDIQKDVLKKYRGDFRRQIVESALEYVKFLVDNPHFRSIIMLTYAGEDGKYKEIRGRLSDLSKELVKGYCRDFNIPPDMAKRKIYVIRSLIYGAALMFDNGQMEYTKENMEYVRMCIDREFDLP